jgi:hypothetical protein
VRIYERIGLLQETSNEDDLERALESRLSDVYDRAPRLIEPEISNKENDRLKPRKRTGYLPRRKITERELDKLTLIRSTVRIT